MREWDAFTETEKRRAVQGLPGVEPRQRQGAQRRMSGAYGAFSDGGLCLRLSNHRGL